jgi:hypothetical protein
MCRIVNRTVFLVLTVMILLGSFLSPLAIAAALEQPHGRIDLELLSGSSPRFVVARVSFIEANSRCPEEQGALRIALGELSLLRVTDLEGAKKTPIEASDDETYRHRIAISDCRIDVAIRQQIRRDGLWFSLPVPENVRPSIPLEKRREIGLQFFEGPKELTPAEREAAVRFLAGEQASAEWYWSGNAGESRSYADFWYGFDGRPKTCFDAFGDYRMERTAVRFFFFTPFPIDLNRFVIERADPDASHGQLYFMRGDCRFELTISQSVLRDGERTPVPLAPIPPPSSGPSPCLKVDSQSGAIAFEKECRTDTPKGPQ